MNNDSGIRSLFSTLIGSKKEQSTPAVNEQPVQCLRYGVDFFTECNEPFFFMRETFLECNSACASLFGAKTDYMQGRSLVEFSPPNQPDGTPSSMKAAAIINSALEGKKQSFFWRFTKLDGTLFDAEMTISLMKNSEGSVLFGSMRDITEKLRSDQQLSAAKERLSVTLKSISEGVITTDLYGQTELINPAALDIIGMELKHLVGRHITEVLVLKPDFAPLLVTDPAGEAMRIGRPFFSPYSALVTNSKNEHRPVRYGAAPMLDRNGRIVGAVVALRDVSETERMEKALLNTQRLESLGVLAGGIAHDFNNLLAGLFGYVEMGQRHLQAGRLDKADNCLTNALSVFDKARSLTQQLLTFSKGGEPVKKVFSIKTLLNTSIPFASSGGILRIESFISPNLPDIEADEGQIGQIIDNIIINAKQAMPNGGILKVSATNVKNGKPPSIKADSCILLEFEDNGPGIPKEILGKLFDPFFTTKPTGSGLGLSTVFSIVRKHGGLIEAGNGPSGGAVFKVWLPATSSAPLLNKTVESTGHSKFNGRALLMDDDPLIRETLSDALSNAGIDCIAVEDSDSAISAYVKALETDEKFCFVILDLSIPGGLGGKETLKKLLAIDRNINAVATSGYAEDPILAKPLLYGFKAALPKPSTNAEIASMASMFCTPSDRESR
ncbi:MAG: PAS domain S-box protein [Fibrobacteres bacterium]|nr:PAS domain S-box protein [Fibrobacterota bacterium]